MLSAYRSLDGINSNRLRPWAKSDFKPHPDDLFQERLYAIHWIAKDSLHKNRLETYFAAPTYADMERERGLEALVV